MRTRGTVIADGMKIVHGATFLFQLRKFAEGHTSVEDFQRLIDHVLVSEAPVISAASDGTWEAEFSFAAEASMYLDMVNDPRSPEYSEAEARRLAGALAALGSQIPPDVAGLLAHFARWAPETVSRIRAHLGGEHTRAAFETFISRRPWPEPHRAAVMRLQRQELTDFADGLATDDYVRVASVIGNVDTGE